jgi:hypothetical protein
MGYIGPNGDSLLYYVCLMFKIAIYLNLQLVRPIISPLNYFGVCVLYCVTPAQNWSHAHRSNLNIPLLSVLYIFAQRMERAACGLRRVSGVSFSALLFAWVFFCSLNSFDAPGNGPPCASGHCYQEKRPNCLSMVTFVLFASIESAPRSEI